MKNFKICILSGAVVVLLVAGLMSCSSGGSDGGTLFPEGGFPTVPKFLIAIDAGAPGKNVNVFPVNATTGKLGSPVAGSPFDLGMTDGMTIAVHRNGHFVYAADAVDGTIHQWKADESSGALTEIAPRSPLTRGLFTSHAAGSPMQRHT